jgi:hypothetical protein
VQQPLARSEQIAWCTVNQWRRSPHVRRPPVVLKPAGRMPVTAYL